MTAHEMLLELLPKDIVEYVIMPYISPDIIYTMFVKYMNNLMFKSEFPLLDFARDRKRFIKARMDDQRELTRKINNKNLKLNPPNLEINNDFFEMCQLISDYI